MSTRSVLESRRDGEDLSKTQFDCLAKWRSSSTATQMGRRKALANSSSKRVLAARESSPARRTILRRSRGHPRPQAGARIAQRHQSSSLQFLLLGAAWVKNHDRVEVRGSDLLLPSLAVQRTAAQRNAGNQRSSVALLLFEPHSLQRSLPLQSQW